MNTDRWQAANERYWQFTIADSEGRPQVGKVMFPERTGQLAASLGVTKQMLKYHVKPMTYTLQVYCNRCKQTSIVTRTFRTRYELECLYSVAYRCDKCEAAYELETAEGRASLNEELRKYYGSLIVRECPNCGYLTHLAFDPNAVDFYEVCSASESCLTADLTVVQRAAFFPKIVALLQARAKLSDGLK